jgi:Protein of unknown function (DUF2937)
MIRVARAPHVCEKRAVPLPRIIRSASAGAERLLDRILCVLGAVLFSQLPEFMQQYLQRLGGALEEARAQLQHFKDAASKSGMSLDQLISSAGQDPDPAMGRMGSVVRSLVARVDELAAAEAALRHASAWSSPFVFAAHLYPGMARATLERFKPAVPTTVEGLLYAAAGMIVVLAAYHLGVRGPLARRLGGRAAARGEPGS